MPRWRHWLARTSALGQSSGAFAPAVSRLAQMRAHDVRLLLCVNHILRKLTLEWIEENQPHNIRVHKPSSKKKSGRRAARHGSLRSRFGPSQGREGSSGGSATHRK